MISSINMAQTSIHTRVQATKSPIEQSSVKNDKSNVSFGRICVVDGFKTLLGLVGAYFCAQLMGDMTTSRNVFALEVAGFFGSLVYAGINLFKK